MFSTFVVMWLSLMLQPCTIAATMSAESPAHAVANVHMDRAHSDSESGSGQDNRCGGNVIQFGICDR